MAQHLVFYCHCGAQLTPPVDQAGLLVACEQCGSKVTVPQLGTPGVQVVEAQISAAQGSRGMASGVSRTKIVLLIIFAGLLAGLGMAYFTRPSILGQKIPLLVCIAQMIKPESEKNAFDGLGDALAIATLRHMLGGATIGLVLGGIAAIVSSVLNIPPIAPKGRLRGTPGSARYQDPAIASARKQRRRKRAAHARQATENLLAAVFIRIPYSIGHLVVHIPYYTSFPLFGRVLQMGEESTLVIIFFHALLWTGIGVLLIWLLIV